jgi:hypothetical protein
MEGDLIAFPLEGGGTVVVEMRPEPSVARVALGDRVRAVGITFEEALTGVRGAAAAALGTFTHMDVKPDEVKITFGIKLDAEAGALIARTGVEGHLDVSLTWRRDEHAPPADDGEPADDGAGADGADDAEAGSAD